MPIVEAQEVKNTMEKIAAICFLIDYAYVSVWQALPCRLLSFNL